METCKKDAQGSVHVYWLQARTGAPLQGEPTGCQALQLMHNREHWDVACMASVKCRLKLPESKHNTAHPTMMLDMAAIQLELLVRQSGKRHTCSRGKHSMAERTQCGLMVLSLPFNCLYPKSQILL